MSYNRFQRREGLSKTAQCSCGASSDLRKRRNFPFGAESTPITILLYKCSTCNKERILNKTQEVKR